MAFARGSLRTRCSSTNQFNRGVGERPSKGGLIPNISPSNGHPPVNKLGLIHIWLPTVQVLCLPLGGELGVFSGLA